MVMTLLGFVGYKNKNKAPLSSCQNEFAPVPPDIIGIEKVKKAVL